MGANEAIVIGTRTDHVPPCKRVAQEFARVSTGHQRAHDRNEPMRYLVELVDWECVRARLGVASRVATSHSEHD
jgi:hypothetical protein